MKLQQKTSTHSTISYKLQSPTKKIAGFLIAMSDFNAEVGLDHVSAGDAIGKFGVNIPVESLIQFANTNKLLVTNTCFKQSKTNRQWTWESTDGHTRNMIDYILISDKWTGSVTNSRAYPKAGIGSHHQLLTNIRSKLKTQKRKSTVTKYDTMKLKLEDPLVSDTYMSMSMSTVDLYSASPRPPLMRYI